MQAMWKHRRAVIEHGRPGRFGRYCLTYLALFHVLLPLIAPVVDVFSLYGLIFLNPVKVIGFWTGFVALQAIAGGYALRLDGEPLRPLWLLPLQQVLYRQLMYLVTIQSVITALLGTRQRWQVIRRAGVFADQSATGTKSPALPAPDCRLATASGGSAEPVDGARTPVVYSARSSQDGSGGSRCESGAVPPRRPGKRPSSAPPPRSGGKAEESCDPGARRLRPSVPSIPGRGHPRKVRAADVAVTIPVSGARHS
jgi:hypothetical protein